MSEFVYTRASYYPATIVARVIDVVAGVVELLLALRLVLELLGANAGAAFVAWIYQASDNLVAPFAGAFPSISLGNGSVLDLSAVLAMIAYAILAWLLIRLFSFVFNSF
jgi:YGGT family